MEWFLRLCAPWKVLLSGGLDLPMVGDIYKHSAVCLFVLTSDCAALARVLATMLVGPSSASHWARQIISFSSSLFVTRHCDSKWQSRIIEMKMRFIWKRAQRICLRFVVGRSEWMGARQVHSICCPSVSLVSRLMYSRTMFPVHAS